MKLYVSVTETNYPKSVHQYREDAERYADRNGLRVREVEFFGRPCRCGGTENLILCDQCRCY